MLCYLLSNIILYTAKKIYETFYMILLPNNQLNWLKELYIVIIYTLYYFVINFMALLFSQCTHQNQTWAKKS